MKWTLVTHRLPSKTKQVDVVFYCEPFAWLTGIFTPKGFAAEKEDTFCRHDENDWGEDDYKLVDDVIAWMELPQPISRKG